MAHKRIIEIDIGQNNNTGLRISALNSSFEVERSIDFESNFGRFQIYNAKEETRKKVLVKNNNIILRCGYEDENNTGLIFFGIIIESTSKKENVNWVSEILAKDFGSNVDLVVKSKKTFNYKAGTTMNIILSDLAGLISVPIIGIENVSDIVLNNGFSFIGSISNALRKLNQIAGVNDIGIYFDQAEMVVYKKGFQDSKFGIISISSKSGLIGEVEEITDEIEEKNVNNQNQKRKTIHFTSLLNPKIKPNSIVKIKSNKVNGAFIITKTTNIGDNFGGSFFTQVEAVD